MVLPILTLRSLSRLRSTLADFLIFKGGLCDMDYIGSVYNKAFTSVYRGTQIPIIFGWSTHEEQTRSGQS